jgi:predicted nucleotidyltransferase
MAQVADIIRKYIAELEKNNIHIKSAILFGSYTKGNYDKWSDIDVALVSDDFEGVRFLDRRKIARITLDVDSRISPFPYRTEDFDKEDLFIKEILETGTKIV